MILFNPGDLSAPDVVFLHGYGDSLGTTLNGGCRHYDFVGFHLREVGFTLPLANSLDNPIVKHDFPTEDFAGSRSSRRCRGF